MKIDLKKGCMSTKSNVCQRKEDFERWIKVTAVILGVNPSFELICESLRNKPTDDSIDKQRKHFREIKDITCFVCPIRRINLPTPKIK